MKKMLMCAFLALSLVGGQLSAYKLTDYVTPNRCSDSGRIEDETFLAG
jgi:hypothetical protein